MENARLVIFHFSIIHSPTLTVEVHMSKKVHMMAIYRIHPEKLEEVEQAVSEFVAAVKENEPEVLFYEAYRGRGDVSFFHIMLPSVASRAHK